MSGKWKPWLVLGLIFIIGIVTGAALAVGFHSEWSRLPEPKQMQSRWQGRLTHRLGLTPEQQAKIGPILATASQQLRDLHRDATDRVVRILEAADGQIMPLLTPEQQEAFKKMHNERPHDFSPHMRRNGPPPPPPGSGPPPPGD